MEKLGSGVFSSVFLVEGDSNKVVKVYSESSKEEACREIETLTIIKNNRKSFKENYKNLYGFTPKSNIITMKGWDASDENNIQIYFKKYTISLEDLYKKYYLKYKETISKDVIKYITNCLMNGLQELKHSGIIHGDLKPENIMLKLENTEGLKNSGKNKKKVNDAGLLIQYIYKSVDINRLIVKIIDFNKSQFKQSVLKSLNIQTDYYMPPEIILGDRNYTEAVDMWAIGSIIYEILTGDVLFDICNKNSIKKEERYKIVDEIVESEEVESADSGEDYEDSKFTNLCILHLYSRYIGDFDLSKDKLKGIFVDEYFVNGHLVGYGNVKTDGGFSWANIDEYFKTLFIRIFNYNYNKRLSIEEYFTYFFR